MPSYTMLKSPQASIDAEACYDYLAERNLDAARRFRQAAEETFALIAGMPNIGVPYKVKDTRMKDLRRFLIKHFTKYLVFYLPVDGGIEIIRILHSARDIRTIMGYDE